MPVLSRQLAIASIVWISVGIVWYIAVRVLMPGHPMPGTAIAVLTWFSAVASAVDRTWLVKRWRSRSDALLYAAGLFCIIAVAAILALSIICVFYFLFFREWPNWPAIRYNLTLDVAWVGLHVIAASLVMKLIRRMELDGQPQKTVSAVGLASSQGAVEQTHSLEPAAWLIPDGESSSPAP